MNRLEKQQFYFYYEFELRVEQRQSCWALGWIEAHVICGSLMEGDLTSSSMDAKVLLRVVVSTSKRKGPKRNWVST